MGKRIAIAIAVLLFTCQPLQAQVGGNPAQIRNPVEARDPVGSGRVPFYGLGRDITRTPNPIDTSMNLVVTGNIASGRQFRGVVPYQATSYFRAPLGSTSLDSFLRRSAGVGNFENIYTYAGERTPFYSQTRTVTTTRPGDIGVIRPPIVSGIRPFPMGGTQRSLPAGSRVLGGLYSTELASGYRPMSMTLEEMELRVSKSFGRYPLGGEEMMMPDEVAIAKYRQEMQKVKEQALALREQVVQRTQLPELKTEIGSIEDIERLRAEQKIKALEQPSMPEIGSIEDIERLRAEQKIKALEQPPMLEIGLDIYEQMKLDIKGLGKSVKELMSGEPAEETGQVQDADEKSVRERIAEVSESVAKVQAMRGEHKSFATYSKDKFNKYMRKAEDFLKEGKYYRAADAYTLALMFKPQDPLAYAGKSHALFASGEYMSSALFLTRALNIFPEYAAFKIDLVAMVGDRDKLESRIADVRFWLEKSDAGELHFLLAYVYYQMGRLSEAVRSIDAAAEKLPDVPAVIVLREAIHTAAKR